MNLAGLVAVRALGFTRRATTGDPGTLWVLARAGTNPRNPSVVFVHGIGIGFLNYLPLLARLPRDRDVYLVEWPHVAMQVSFPALPLWSIAFT